MPRSGIVNNVATSVICQSIVGSILLFLSEQAIAISLDIAPQPQKCQISGSLANLDFGTHTRADLQITSQGKLNLGRKITHISVTCLYPQKMILSITGNTADQQFSWGEAGKVRATIQDAQLDGNSAMMSRLKHKEAPLSVGFTSLKLSPGEYFTLSEKGKQISGRQLTFSLVIEPELEGDKVKLNRPYTGQSLLSLQLH